MIDHYDTSLHSGTSEESNSEILALNGKRTVSWVRLQFVILLPSITSTETPQRPSSLPAAWARYRPVAILESV
jgi:hypothetical protein